MARRSPPRHRHDGSSPLPLGMDASPAPQRWNGASTVWPHDPRTGWSYCVMIPSWVTIPQAKTPEGTAINPTVFYRVQVGIQSPQGISAARGILRRFSDFLKLFAALKRVFPRKKLPAAPPKNTLMRINSSQTLLQERRWALEDWFGRLLADIEISRSVPIASFLELEAAARFAVNSIADQQANGPVSVGAEEQQSSGPVAVGLVTHPSSASVLPSPRSAYSWTGGSSSVASGPFPSGLDDGNDSAYDTQEEATPGKTSEGDLELEREALGLDEERAIMEASEGMAKAGLSERKLSVSSSVSNAADLRTTAAQVGVLQGELQRGDGRVSGTVQEIPGEVNPGVSRGQLQSSESIAWHRRKASQESFVSEIESVRESEPSVAPSVDGHIEGTSWGLGGIEERTIETESILKGVGLVLSSDQRGKVRRVLSVLQRRLTVAKSDMENLIARLNQETAVKEFLATKVRDLEADLDTTRRKSREVLQQAVSLERDRVTSLQWELEESRQNIMNLEESSFSEKEARELLEKRLGLAESARESAEKEAAELREKMIQLQQERDTIEAQSRADKKVLVKEIKSLRNVQLELKKDVELAQQVKLESERVLDEERRKQETVRKSRASFLREVATLRQRLQECTVDYLAREEEKSANKSSSAVTDALDLLSTSDNRIGLLLAEAQLLSQEDGDDGMSTASQPTNGFPQRNGDGQAGPDMKLKEHAENLDSDLTVKKMLIDLIVDNAQLRKAMNHSLTQSALSSQKVDKEAAMEGFPFRKGVLSKFLGTQ
ncbi:hypothetical protein R1flu_002309 [Riccia fluitans]|uniref:PX domain-containing protein n=1 Tax=Riccia fluitans TaxID=41844 RepID=A0ABD1Y6R5_9MARC